MPRHVMAIFDGILSCAAAAEWIERSFGSTIATLKLSSVLGAPATVSLPNLERLPLLGCRK
jgi:hypothetical protein